MIDPEVALKACQQVLLNVRLQGRDVLDTNSSPSPGPSPTPIREGEGPKADNSSEHGKPPTEAPPIQNSPPLTPSIQVPVPHTPPTQASAQAPPPQAQPPQAPPSARQSWLLRLFESRLFDVSMAVSYLYKSKDPGVQAYIGNRLFSFGHAQVDFYLPQLLNMYVHMDEEVGDAIRPYLVSLAPAAVTPAAAAAATVFTVFCSQL